MLRFIAQRLGAALVLIVVVSFVAFVLTWFSPGDPALAILGQAASPAALAAKRADLGPDRNVFEAYFARPHPAPTGALGTSCFSNRPVS